MVATEDSITSSGPVQSGHMSTVAKSGPCLVFPQPQPMLLLSVFICFKENIGWKA